MPDRSDTATLVNEVIRSILSSDVPIWSDSTRDIRVEDDRSGRTSIDPPFRVIVSVGVETFIIGFPTVDAAAHGFLRAIGPDAAQTLEFPREYAPSPTDSETITENMDRLSEMLRAIRLAAPIHNVPPSPFVQCIALALRDGFSLSWLTRSGRPITVHRSPDQVDDDGTVKTSYRFTQGRKHRSEGNVRSYHTAERAANRFIAMIGPERAQAALKRAIAEQSAVQ